MKYVIQDTTLTAIGDAIREKGGTTELIPVVDLADAITSLPSGGAKVDFYPEVSYATLKLFGTANSTSVRKGMDVAMHDTIFHPWTTGYSSLFRYYGSEYLPDVDLAIDEIDWDASPIFTYYLSGAYHLKKLPTKFLQIFKHIDAPASAARALEYCYSVDKIEDFPVSDKAWSGVDFDTIFTGGLRTLRKFTFETNPDGTPKVANWTKCTFPMTNMGYSKTSISISKTTKTTSVDRSLLTDEEDENWYGSTYAYSKMGAYEVSELIYSLPDTTAAGGSNTIAVPLGAGNNTQYYEYGYYGDANTVRWNDVSNISASTKAVATARGWTLAISMDYR